MRRNISELKAKIAELEAVKFDVGCRIDELRRELDTETDKQYKRRHKRKASPGGGPTPAQEEQE